MASDEDVDEEAADTAVAEETRFDPASTPRQVQIVDFLDSIRRPPLAAEIQRLVVIVSAWDKSVTHTDPHVWLADRMGLLDQYLRNSDIEVRIYGVSAQGGDLPDADNPPAPDDVAGQKERNRLLSFARASERIGVVGHGASSHDLTHPIRWLSGLEGE